MVPLILESDNQEQISSYLSEKYLLQNAVAEIRTEGNSISLDSIKHLIGRAKFSPGQKKVVFIIYDGHLITPAGQNALLKTLEESGQQQQFVITTINHHLLLPTIVSRCQVINLKQKTEAEPDGSLLKQFIHLLETESSCISGSETIIGINPSSFLDKIIRELHQANRTLPTQKRLKIISLALGCLTDLKRNINQRLALDHFLLASRKTIQ